MNLGFAFLAGAAGGLAFFGSLWLTVRRAVHSWGRFSNLPRSCRANNRVLGAEPDCDGNGEVEIDSTNRAGWKTCPTVGASAGVAMSRMVRFALLALVLCFLARAGGGSLCAGLAGFWTARWGLVLGLGVVRAQ